MKWADRIGRRVKLRDLHILLAVAKWRSISKAAEHLAISHPVVSKTITNLEHTLELRLFDRNPRGVEPTIYGRALITCGVAVLDELQQGVKQLEFLSNPTEGEVWIGSTDPLMAGFIPALIDRLITQHPRIIVHATQDTFTSLHVALRKREIDLMVGRILHSADEDDFEKELLFREQLFVVSGIRSPWARRRNIELAELVGERWILQKTDTPAGSLVEGAFRSADLILPRAAVVSSSIPLRNSLLRTGRFLAVFAGSVFHFGIKPASLKILPVKLPIEPQPIGILTLKDRTLSPLAQLFIANARAMAKSLGQLL